jgi:hypothetical protein
VKLIEVLVAIAVVAVALGAAIGAIGAFGRATTHQAGPIRSAAMLLAEQTLRVAQDAWKYGSPGTSPSGSWSTTVPLNLPNGVSTTAPVTVTTTTSDTGAQSALVTVNVRYTPDPYHQDDPGAVSMTGQAQVRSPVPGATVVNPSLVPKPTGAP